jgi:hypothetical protein
MYDEQLPLLPPEPDEVPEDQRLRALGPAVAPLLLEES